MIDAVTLREPAWLLLFLLPVIAARLSRREDMAPWAEPALRPWAVRNEAGIRWRWPVLAFAWVLLAIAAAGPRQSLPDDSGRMATRGDVALMAVVEAELFADARLELYELMARLRGERLGIVVYGRDAVLVSPPTTDPDAFAFYLEKVPGLTDSGSDGLLPALDRAVAALPTEGSRALILFSQGPIPEEADSKVRAWVERGIDLHVLGFAPEPGLARLAAAGQGRFAEAVPGDGDWAVLYDAALAGLQSTARAEQPAWRELYPWFLAPALVLFLIGLFPPGRVAPLLLLAAMVVAPPAKADERTAYGAYRTGDYARAQADYAAASGYAARMGEGASAYRRANFAHALAQFRFAALIAPDASSRADALYNLGNAALRAGDPPLAVEAYRGALALRDEARTRHNLALAQARLATFLAGQEQGIRPGRHVAEVGQGWDPEQSDFPPDEESVASTYRRGDASAAAATPSDHSPWQTTERDYRAGLKKLELLEDQTAEVLRGLAAGERSP